MKQLTYLILLLLNTEAYAQQKEIVQQVSRDWNAFKQSVDASFLETKMKIKLSGEIRASNTKTNADAGIWMWLKDKNGELISRLQPTSLDSLTGQWQRHTIEHEIPANTGELIIGFHCKGHGQFYFDNIQLLIQDSDGIFKNVKVLNGDFEKLVSSNIIPFWSEGIKDKYTERVKGYTVTTSAEHVTGNYSVMIEGKNLEKDSSYLIAPTKGYSPEIGILVSMLNNLKNRVEESVLTLSDNDADYLIDDKANTIGALLMHLAAAEVYYQVATFENRSFNEEEKQKWEAALRLGDEARKTIKGKPIEYYLEIYAEVRQKTMEELKRRSADWLLEETWKDSGVNNYWSWFHMIEHQSSHLGQMRMILKRLPPEKDRMESEHIDFDH